MGTTYTTETANTLRANRQEWEGLYAVVRDATGQDLAHYTQPHLLRRLKCHLNRQNLRGLSDLIHRITHNPVAARELVDDLSVPVSEMFRDPVVFRQLRHEVLQALHNRPYLKIWHAGCATGEEVYSLCILLYEHGLYDRSLIYATDISAKAIYAARLGIFPARVLKRFSRNYFLAGGTASLSRYYRAGYGFARFDPALRLNVVFSRHDLAAAPPTDADLILCRNVLIYFSQSFQVKLIQQFAESLPAGGFLCLGAREALPETIIEQRIFEALIPGARIYRRL